MVARLTQIDYDREMAFVATIEEDGAEVEIGVARYGHNPTGKPVSSAIIVVAEDWQHLGPARRSGVLIETARNRRPPRHDRDLPVQQRPHARSSRASASS
jgi:acetyltransferase